MNTAADGTASTATAGATAAGGDTTPTATAGAGGAADANDDDVAESLLTLADDESFVVPTMNQIQDDFQKLVLLKERIFAKTKKLGRPNTITSARRNYINSKAFIDNGCVDAASVLFPVWLLLCYVLCVMWFVVCCRLGERGAPAARECRCGACV
jgi:hypothetical protein